MKQNVGTTDRAARVVIGVLLIGAALAGGIGAWGYIGILPLATGLFGTCPVYSWFGINSCSRKEA